MRFIHTADLHLDSPFNNLKSGLMPDALWRLVYHSTYRSFERIVKAAVREHVDFVLIVGDLFDREVRSVKAQSFLKQNLEDLNQHQIPVMMSFGNHDFYNGDYQTLHYPLNTYVFPTRVTTHTVTLEDGQRVGITGFSYGSRWETQRMIKQFPVKGKVDYQIGMIHGQVSSGSANYTPFSLDELKSKHYDYWALGHIHKRQALCKQPPVWYCGNIQGRNPNETGEKGYLLVDSQQHFRPQFYATSVINWQTLTYSIKENQSEEQLVERLLLFLKRQHFSKLHLLKLNFEVDLNNDLSTDLLNMMRNGNLLEQLQIALQSRYAEVRAWVYQLDLKILQSYHQPVILDQPYWQKSAKRTFTLANLDHLAKKLFQHSFINHRFNHEKAVNDLEQRAKQLIQGYRSQNHDH